MMMKFFCTRVKGRILRRYINLERHINEIKHTLKPPVSNKVIIDGNIKVMIVGGPNDRTDYHIEMGDELFYQIKGDMNLDIVQNGKTRSRVLIKEGELFLLPAGIPHSPQRYANTIGLVLERTRSANEIDCLRWYKGESCEIEYEEYFHCKDLGTQVKAVIENYFKHTSDPNSPTIKVDPKFDLMKQALLCLRNESNLRTTFSFNNEIQSFINCNKKDNRVLFDGEFRMTLVSGHSPSNFYEELQFVKEKSTKQTGPCSKQIFLWQIRGKSNLRNSRIDINLESGDINIYEIEMNNIDDISFSAESDSCIVLISNRNV